MPTIGPQFKRPNRCSRPKTDTLLGPFGEATDQPPPRRIEAAQKIGIGHNLITRKTQELGLG